MNQYISGIIKIVFLEASIGLILLDRVAGSSFLRARKLAFTTLAGLMVFAWANYGSIRGGTSVGFILTAVPMVLLFSFMMHSVFSSDDLTARMKSFNDWAVSTAKTLKLSAAAGSKAVTVTLIAVLAAGWVWFGHRSANIELVHPWEQFHFYLGAKYQREVGWFNLYKAAVLADRETVNAMANIKTIRDISTFDQVDINVALQDADAVKARFAPERWQQFKEDWVSMTRTWPMNWEQAVNDHGNSNSPAWSLVAAPLTRLFSISHEGQSLLGWLDMLLMLGLWLFIFETFGAKVAHVGLLVWAAPPLVFDYLSGSLLRWDWLFAIGLAACFIKREQWKTAGAFFAYAVATKLFPLFFGVALLLKLVPQWVKTKSIEKKYLQFAASTAITGALLVALSSAMFGPSSWSEYAQRIQVAQTEKFYGIQYSLKTVYLQFVESSSAEISRGWFFPAEMKQARNDVDIKDHAFGFLMARLAFAGLVFVLVRRATDAQAFLTGPLLVFAFLTVNMYYWNMLGLLAIGMVSRLQRAGLAFTIGLHVIFMAYYFRVHFNQGLSDGYAAALMLVVLTCITAFMEWRDSRPTAVATSA